MKHVRTSRTSESSVIVAMYFDKSKRMTNLCCFTKTTIHTGDQQGPSSPYVGERSHTAKVSSGTSNFPVGDARKQCASNLNNRIVNPLGGDGPIDANGMSNKYNAKSSRLRRRIDRNVENQRHCDFDGWRRSSPVCQYFIVLNKALSSYNCT